MFLSTLVKWLLRIFWVSRGTCSFWIVFLVPGAVGLWRQCGAAVSYPASWTAAELQVKIHILNDCKYQVFYLSIFNKVLFKLTQFHQNINISVIILLMIIKIFFLLHVTFFCSCRLLWNILNHLAKEIRPY